MWITSTEYRKKYNITPQHLYALKKSGKITFKPYVGKEVLILDENDLNDDKLNCVYARITSKESEDVLNEQITYIKKYMVSNGFQMLPAVIHLTEMVSETSLMRLLVVL